MKRLSARSNDGEADREIGFCERDDIAGRRVSYTAGLNPRPVNREGAT
jgi:hypothetical protein